MESRKRQANFYAVARTPSGDSGVFEDWGQAKKLCIDSSTNQPFRGAKFKKFASSEEAKAFVEQFSDPSAPTRSEKGSSSHSSHSVDESEIDLHVYTDGACENNGKRGASAGYGVYFGPDDPRNESRPLKGEKQTNQRAELTAILRALEIEPEKKLIIHSDSKYSMNCVTEWIGSWKKNGWKTAGGKPVLNRDLIEPIDRILQEKPNRVRFEWVRGHSGDKGNDEADRLAREGKTRCAR